MNIKNICFIQYDYWPLKYIARTHSCSPILKNLKLLKKDNKIMGFNNQKSKKGPLFFAWISHFWLLKMGFTDQNE